MITLGERTEALEPSCLGKNSHHHHIFISSFLRLHALHSRSPFLRRQHAPHSCGTARCTRQCRQGQSRRPWFRTTSPTTWRQSYLGCHYESRVHRRLAFHVRAWNAPNPCPSRTGTTKWSGDGNGKKMTCPWNGPRPPTVCHAKTAHHSGRLVGAVVCARGGRPRERGGAPSVR